MLNRVCLWVRSILPRRRLEREMQEEMAQHLERATVRLMARGLTADEARNAATREFGNVANLQEEARDARGGRWLEAFARDIRFALRHLGRKPGMTITIVLVLTIGMSISTVLFSFLHSYSVQPPPGIVSSDDLVRIRGSQRIPDQGRGFRLLSRDELQEYQSLAGWDNERVIITGDGERSALSTTASFVTDNYFAVLGVRPILGAGLPATESVSRSIVPMAIISHDAWDKLFAKSPGAVGSTLTAGAARHASDAGEHTERLDRDDRRIARPPTARDSCGADRFHTAVDRGSRGSVVDVVRQLPATRAE